MSFAYVVHSLPLSLLAGLLAAAAAWQWNRGFAHLSEVGQCTCPLVSLLAPLGEEAAKTLLAMLLGADIFLSHFFFGAVEGIWEVFSVRRGGFYAGLAALAGHSVFGYLTVFALEWYGALLPALAAGYLAHTVWNFTVLTCIAPRGK